MKKNSLAIVAVGLCFMMSLAFAGNDASAELTTLLAPIHTMQSNFTQAVTDNRGKALQRSYGRMAVARPSKFRWEVKRPIPQLVIANGSRLWIYDSDLQQVTIRHIDQSAADETPASLLSQVDVVLNNNYRVTKLPQSNTAWQWYSLKPKRSDNMFAGVQMGFMNGQIRQMRLQDHLGHNTTIQFVDPRINTPLPASQFVFRAPRNVDVIDETRRKR